MTAEDDLWKHLDLIQSVVSQSQTISWTNV